MRSRVKGLKNYDSSFGGRHNIIRQLKQLRLEVKQEAKAIRNSQVSKSKERSPYVKDNPQLHQNLHHGSSRESEWKEVPSYEEERARASSFNLRKLDIY